MAVRNELCWHFGPRAWKRIRTVTSRNVAPAALPEQRSLIRAKSWAHALRQSAQVMHFFEVV